MARIPRLPLFFAALALLILVAARWQLDAHRREALQLRVEVGEGATVPAELTALVENWSPAERYDEGKAALGRLLFFDPLLSANQQVSCASCHHPDIGLSDGRAHAIGVSAIETARHTPTLWNNSDRNLFNWDGRASSIEAQILTGALVNSDEMANTWDQVVTDLTAIAPYNAQFISLYGELTAPHVADALGQFVRTFVSRDSAFDRYARGDYYALTGAQRRGLALFQGERMNCAACHELPAFRSDGPKVIGVRDDLGRFDEGMGAINGQETEVGAFVVPTLRNAALHPPYMHNGSEPGLNSVISFYLNGGGNNINVPRSRLSDEIHAFSATTRELEDLELFLMALTDESNVPSIPDNLPSGLAPVAPRENPARASVAEAAALPRSDEPRTHFVEYGGSIQAAIDKAQPGDIVMIPPGRFYENLVVDVENLTLVGNDTTLVGRPFTPVGIEIRHNNLTLRGIALESFPDATLWLHNARNTTLDNVTLNGQTVNGSLERLASR